MNLEEIKLEKLTLEDLDELKNISRQTYSDTFSWGNSPENMESYLDSAFNAESLSVELQNPDSDFYFAKYNGEIVGYFKINQRMAQTDLRDDEALELERIYILKQFQGKGLGTFLLNLAIDLGKRQGTKYIWLGVWEKNEKAIQFYKRNHFEIFGSHVFQMGNEAQIDYLMKREI